MGNREFPPSKWVRKLRPYHLIIVILEIVFFGMFVPKLLMLLLPSLMIIGLALAIWGLYWIIKYPIHTENCKECGRVLPIKYEDDK